MSQKKVKKGQRVTVTYENREFEVIVIDPNGLGKEQPSLGFGLNMMQIHGGLPKSTASGWIKDVSEGVRIKGDKFLKAPNGDTFDVFVIPTIDSNEPYVVEIANWVLIAGEAIKAKGRKKVSDSTRNKLVDFLTWFATKGLYAEAYVQLKGQYTARDSRSISNWMMVRLEGKIKRTKYTDFLQEQGCQKYDYARWTNYIYEGLFGKTATEIKQLWNVVEGNKEIARNYIAKEEGLKAVAYCESQAVELHIENLRDSHDDAIYFTRKKFKDILPDLN